MRPVRHAAETATEVVALDLKINRLGHMVFGIEYVITGHVLTTLAPSWVIPVHG